METFPYLLKVNLAIVVFTTFYKVFYCKDTFFSLRRYLLLSMLILSALYPLVDFSRWMIHSITVTSVAVSYNHIMPEVILYNTPDTGASTATSVSLMTWLLRFYFTVACFFILRILFQAAQIVWFRLHSKPTVIQEIRIFRLKDNTLPFSFFSWIFIHPEMHTENELQEILTHESVHARQRHSFDVVLSDLVCALCWINPMAWMIKKEIRKNLEFIVDQSIVNRYPINIKAYQYHLLKLTGQPEKMTLVNQFNISPIKERIMMINKKKSPQTRLAAYSLVLPLVLLLLAVNNVGMVAERLNVSEKMSAVANKVSTIVTIPSPETIQQVEPTDESVLHASSFDNETMQELSGTILDLKTNKAMQGVTVSITGTNKGTVSDVQGRFKLNVNDTDSVSFSFIGYASMKLSAKNLLINNPVTLKMMRAVRVLEEFTVIAFGVTKDLKPSEAKVNEPVQPTSDSKTQETTVTETRTESTRKITTVTKESEYEKPEAKVQNQNDEEENIFVLPQFPGGTGALMKFVSENINYPVIAAENGIQGQVMGKFTIQEDGSIGDVEIVNQRDPSLDKEVVRVINQMPKWTPGNLHGKNVSFYYALPVNFRLVEQNK